MRAQVFGTLIFSNLPVFDIATPDDPGVLKTQPDQLAELSTTTSTSTSMSVLVVEDSREFAELVTMSLRDQNHDVRVAATLADAVTAIRAVPPDLVILDLSLPDGDGLDLLRSFDEDLRPFIIVLSGRDNEVDKVLGFRFGADDYVTKPFSPRELAARVEAMARRLRRRSKAASLDLIADGDVTMSISARTVVVGGTLIELTRTEFDLLATFLSAKTQVMTRESLLERVWGADWFGDLHVVDVHIANLRRKLAKATSRPVVRTVRGVGYGLAAA